MIDSLNLTGSGNDTDTSSTGQVSLVEIVLADAPFLALGFLGLALITFYSALNRSHRIITYLQLASLTAAFAALVDLVGMFYNQNDVAVNSFHEITSPGLRTFIIALLVTKQVLLSISLVFRLLYFYQSLENHRTGEMKAVIPAIVDDDEKRRPKSFTETMLGRVIPMAQRTTTSDEDMIGVLVRLLIYSGILVIFGLELGWRLGFLLNRGAATSFAQVNMASYAIQLILLLAYTSCPFHFIIKSSPSFRMYILKMYGGMLFANMLGLVVVIGSLASLGFSERVTGRLLQGVQMYVLIASQLMIDFSSRRPKSGITPARFTIVNGNHDGSQSMFEGLATPKASTFRASPPNVRTPSPSQVPPIPNGRKVSFQPAARPYSTGTMLDVGSTRQPVSRWSTASVSNRLLSWVVVGRGGRQSDAYAEETRGLQDEESMGSPVKSPDSIDTSMFTMQHTGEATYRGSTGSGLPAAPSPARRSGQTTLRDPLRLENRSTSRVSSLVGIKRTISSPGARLLVLGPDAAMPNRGSRYNSRYSSRPTSTPSDITVSRDSAMSLPLPPIQDLGFPRPPSRHLSGGMTGQDKGPNGPMSIQEADVEMDMDDELPLPSMPAARAENRIAARSHSRYDSRGTHVDVTSFIEGGSEDYNGIDSRLFQAGSPQTRPGSLRRDVTSFVAGSNRISQLSAFSPSPAHTPAARRLRQSSLSDIGSVSSEAPTERYMPDIMSPHVHSRENDDGEGSDILTPTHSVWDVNEARVKRVIVQPSSLQATAGSASGSGSASKAESEKEASPRPPLPMSLPSNPRPRSGLPMTARTHDSATSAATSRSQAPASAQVKQVMASRPESPTLPPSAGAIEPRVAVQRAASKSSSWYRAKYGDDNMV
ncbi:hypothetical protein IAT38_005665 [Cryptococcus sp. DSM 104549]